MKRYILILALSALGTFGSLAYGEDKPFVDGTDRGNGGDEYSQSFVELGYELVESLMKDPIAGVDTNALYRAVEATKVNSEERLELRGYEVDAINYPDAENPRIVMSRLGWDRMSSATHKRIFLVFHEYLGIMGVDDSSYQISLRLDRAKVCDRDPVVRAEIEDELKKSCYRVIPDDLRYVRGISAEGSLSSLVSRDFSGLDKLSQIRIAKNRFSPEQLAVIKPMKQMAFLDLGSSVTDLSDCSFLNDKPKLYQIWLSDSGYWRDATSFRPLLKVQEGCFARTGAQKINNVMVSLDGKLSHYRGFLYGLKSEGLQIDGVNLANLSSEEFLGVQLKQITLTEYDHTLTEKKVKEIGAALGFSNCLFPLPTQVSGPWQYTCRNNP